MKPDRHQARILAMQMLCQLDAQGDEALTQLDTFLEESQACPDTCEYAGDLVRRCWGGRVESQGRIQSQLVNWELERLSPVERNVIRVGLAELSDGAVPPKVVINEAVEIAREYGTAESGRFVNGVLDGLWKANEN
ncbi:MAG: transcription antitermination factor NusB [Phycisphaerae bacterium]